MKTFIQPTLMTCSSRPSRICFLIAGFLFAAALVASAKLPEPDMIVYGQVIVDGQILSSTRTDVVVSARRISDSAIIDAYRLGDDPDAGNRYVLRVPLESLSPLMNPTASLFGESFEIIAQDMTGLLIEQSLPPADRGFVVRQDLIIGDPPSGGLPEDWQLHYFGSLGQDPNQDPDSDGQNNRQEYEAGTNPVRSDDVFVLKVEIGGTGTVSFQARAAEGPGYTGLMRVYSLQTASNLSPADWQIVPGYEAVVGQNQEVQFQLPQDTRLIFFRATAQLTP